MKKYQRLGSSETYGKIKHYFFLNQMIPNGILLYCTWFFLSDLLIVYLCVTYLHVCLYVAEIREGIRASGTEVKGVCEPSRGI